MVWLYIVGYIIIGTLIGTVVYRIADTDREENAIAFGALWIPLLVFCIPVLIIYGLHKLFMYVLDKIEEAIENYCKAS